MHQESTLERAFALAESSSCRTVSDIRTQLKKERHEAVDAHLSGMMIQRQLKELLARRES